MKAKVLIVLFALVASLPSFGFSLSIEENEKTDIELEKGNIEDKNKHARTSEFIPLSCYYQQGNIYLDSSVDLGESIVTLTCLETGEVQKFSQSLNIGTVCLPASLGTGKYLIEIETEYGDWFYGYYTL
ncbi:MAG: hypothetical protein Q4A54_00070 [Parabacteroides sp.]|nr:hypothetical protein [Parabacteroides sp.]